MKYPDAKKDTEIEESTMKTLHFTLSGKTAFFKKPEVNTYVYFTYGNIHKIALLGIFGAILGYEGHTQKFARVKNRKMEEESFPEFYEKLSHLNVSVIPEAENGFIRKKIQAFNNSVGYASGEQGGNLIVKEQWLEDPHWEIYLLLDCDEAEKLCKAVQDRKCVYIPYLGKNDHFADISQARVEEAEEWKAGKDRIDSLFPKENGKLQVSDDFWAEEAMTFKYEEKLPVKLDALTNNYILQSFVYTDSAVVWENQKVYRIDDKMIMFY